MWTARAAAGTLLLATLLALPAVPQAEPARKRMSGKAPAAPWSVTYSDGSGNGFRFWRDAKTAAARFEYSPVRPEESSTGLYSGGEPKAGKLDDRRAGELWEWVRKLEADRSLRAPERAKGTGAFRLKDPAGREREFLIEMGPRLREFDTFVAPFRGGKPGLAPGGSKPAGPAGGGDRSAAPRDR